MDSLTFLDRVAKATLQPLYVLYGDEPFLKRLVRDALRRLVLGADDDGLALASHPGDRTTWAAVLDDLRTRPFLSPRRLVIVEDADPFVSAERSRLEKYVADLDNAPATGVLVLEVQSWAASTKLAKAVPDRMTITCNTPAVQTLPDWCVRRCAAQYGKQLGSAAARRLVDLVGPEMGQLDQELDKLALYVGAAARIEAEDVSKLVGRTRTDEVWELFDLIGAGKASEALRFLDKLLEQGAEPMKLLGAFSTRLRELAKAARLNAQGVALREALVQAGVPGKWEARLRAAETQMRHLGRRRLDQLYDWLLQTDQGMKGGSQLPPRTLLERLVVRLARSRT
jgi:DNA polymerase-3 subunit delta